MLALKMLIYGLVNSAFSSFASLKLALVIQLLRKMGYPTNYGYPILLFNTLLEYFVKILLGSGE